MMEGSESGPADPPAPLPRLAGDATLQQALHAARHNSTSPVPPPLAAPVDAPTPLWEVVVVPQEAHDACLVVVGQDLALQELRGAIQAQAPEGSALRDRAFSFVRSVGGRSFVMDPRHEGIYRLSHLQTRAGDHLMQVVLEVKVME